MKKVIIPFILILIVFAIACKKDTPFEPTKPNTSANAVLDLGNPVNAKFFGVVEDETGNLVSGVLISAGNKTASTDANGVFIIEDASVFEDLAYVTASKPGYFLGSRSLIPSTTATNNIRITLLDMNTVGTVNSGEEKTISLPSGAKIDFKGKYVDLNGNPYSGVVNVAFKHLPALAPETSNQMPGMLYAQNENKEAGVLETYGMIAVELIGASGEELQLDPSSTASIHMPVDPSQLSSAPTSIPLWHFDEVAGYWIEDGSANLEGGEYVGEVSHFSFWNCDIFTDGTYIFCMVIDQNGNPLPNTEVSIITPNANTTGLTSNLGSFGSYVPANSSITLSVVDDCGTSALPTNVGPYTSSSTNNETITGLPPNPPNYVQVTGLFYDCSNNLITNGYVHLTAGVSSYNQSITNGVVNLPILFCNVPTNLTSTAYDLDNFQETNTITTPIITPITNLGSLNACNALNEYITYSIDGGTPEVYSTPIGCNLDLNLIVVSHNSSFFLLSNTTTESVNIPYGNTGMTISSNTISIDETLPVNITFNLNAWGPMGSYADITFSGDYTELGTGDFKTINGSIYALRDF